MEVKLTYPNIRRRLRGERILRTVFFWTLLAFAVAAGIVNLSVGGPAWSVVVAWALWCVWSCFVSRPLVENHWMGRTTLTVLRLCVLLILIDTLLAPGWADFVVPLVGVALLIALGAIFFSNLPRRRQNVHIIFWVSLLSIAAFCCALNGWLSLNWPMIVLGSVAPALLIAGIAVLRKQFFIELKKRFHL